MEVVVHHSIADLYKTLGLPIEEDLDFTILSVPELHHTLPYKSPDLRADYYSFILTKEGSGVYYLDDHKFPFESGSIYFTNPGHVKSYELFESKEAWIITLTDRFFREHVHTSVFSEFPFLLAELVPPRTLNQAEFKELEQLYQQMYQEFQGASPYKNQILGNLFLVLLLKIKELAWMDYNPREEGSRSSQLVKSFRQELEWQFKHILKGEPTGSRLQVSYFADKLNLHPNYLNSVIRSKTGKTVNEWISKRMLSVAKSLLLSSDMSTKEIAYRLGYSDPTHFSRFFKSQTRQSPSSFRSQPAQKANR